MNRIELVKFYDYLADNGVIREDEKGKAFRWIDNYSSTQQKLLNK